LNGLLTLSAHHGYLLIFLTVIAESLGLPIPAALALIAGGAAASTHVLNLLAVFIIAVLAILMGDTLLFIAGRYMGWALLGMLCKVSINPETCILRSAETFYRRGKTTLLFSKFIPGVNTMAPPLAGSMKMPPQQFLQLEAAGASLYALIYIALGFVFHNFLAALTRGVVAASHAMEIVLFVALAGYIGYRVWLYRKHSVYRAIPRVQVEELAQRLTAEKNNILVVDVRSHGYYDSYAARIAGSIRIEPNNLTEEAKTLPKDKDIYLYCT